MHSTYVGRHRTVIRVNVVQEMPTKISFKGDNVLIKTSNCENLDLYFSKKFQQSAAFAVLFFGFQ